MSSEEPSTPRYEFSTQDLGERFSSFDLEDITVGLVDEDHGDSNYIESMKLILNATNAKKSEKYIQDILSDDESDDEPLGLRERFNKGLLQIASRVVGGGKEDMLVLGFPIRNDFADEIVGSNENKKDLNEIRRRRIRKVLAVATVISHLLVLFTFVALLQASMILVHIIPSRYIHPSGSRIESFVISPDIGPNPYFTLKAGFGMIGNVMRFESQWYLNSFARALLGTFSSKGLVDGVVMFAFMVFSFLHATLSPRCLAFWTKRGSAWPLLAVWTTICIFLLGNLVGHLQAIICLWDEVTQGTIPGSMALNGFAIYIQVRDSLLYFSTALRNRILFPRKNVSEILYKSSQEMDESVDLSLGDMKDHSTHDVSIEEVPVDNVNLDDSFTMKDVYSSAKKIKRIITFMRRRSVVRTTVHTFQVLLWLLSPIVIPNANAFSVWAGFLVGILCGGAVYHFSLLFRSNMRMLSVSSFLRDQIFHTVACLAPILILLAWKITLVSLFLSRTDPNGAYTPKIFRYLSISMRFWDYIANPWEGVKFL